MSINNYDIRPIVIFGAGGFGLEVAMLIEQINAVCMQWDIIGFFDDGLSRNTMVSDWKVLGGLHELNDWETPLDVVFALGIPATKRRVIENVNNSQLSFPVLIHPTVVSGNSKFVEIGEGSILCAGTIITTNINIGRHVIINLACTVGHESIIGDYCSFMPGCSISGEVSIGEASYWGTGAKIINRIRVGSNTVVGAGAVITQDIPDNVTAVGIPAKILQK